MTETPLKFDTLHQHAVKGLSNNIKRPKTQYSVLSAQALSPSLRRSYSGIISIGLQSFRMDRSSIPAPSVVAFWAFYHRPPTASDCHVWVFCAYFCTICCFLLRVSVGRDDLDGDNYVLRVLLPIGCDGHASRCLSEVRLSSNNDDAEH